MKCLPIALRLKCLTAYKLSKYLSEIEFRGLPFAYRQNAGLLSHSAKTVVPRPDKRVDYCKKMRSIQLKNPIISHKTSEQWTTSWLVGSQRVTILPAN